MNLFTKRELARVLWVFSGKCKGNSYIDIMKKSFYWWFMVIQTPTFAEVIDALDKTIEHDQQVLLPTESGGGRAYLKGPTQYYGAEVFFGNRGEEHYGRVKGFETSKCYKGGIYMGAAGIVNLSYIAAMRSEAAILYDVNPHQKIFWNVFVELLAQHQGKSKFEAAFKDAEDIIRLRILSAVTNPNLHQYFYGVSNPNIAGNIYRGFMPYLGEMPIVSSLPRQPRAELIWFESDEHYEYIHQLAKAGKIGAITLDVCDETSILALADVLGDQKLACLYISNIFKFLADGSDWTERNFTGRESPTVERAKQALRNLLLQNTLIVSNNRIETNYWNEEVYKCISVGSSANARDKALIP